MSLRDTINGARQEAQDAGMMPGAPKDSDSDGDEAQERTGFSKKSISRAKPSREAAEGVRVVSHTGRTVSGGKREADMSKEEKKAHKKRERDAADRRAAASQILLKNSDEYRKGYRLWWILLGIAVGVTVVSWLLVYNFPDQSSDYSTPLGIFSIVAIVLAYACIIGAFVYDWRHVRPLRKRADAAVAGMTEKRVMQILTDDAEKVAKEEAERAQAKEAKKQQRGSHKAEGK